MGFRCPGSGQQEPAFSRVVLVGEGCCSCVRARDAPRAYFLCALLSSTQFLVVFELLGSISSVVLLHLPWVGSKLWDSPLPLFLSSITHSHGKKDHHSSTRPPPYAHVRPLIPAISCSCNLQTSLLCSGKKISLSIISHACNAAREKKTEAQFSLDQHSNVYFMCIVIIRPFSCGVLR